MNVALLFSPWALNRGAGWKKTKQNPLRRTRAQHDEEAFPYWASLTRGCGSDAGTKPHSTSEGRGLKCLPLRHGPAETCVATEHFSIQHSVGENTLFSQEAELNTQRWLFFSVKQVAESDLGDSHQTPLLSLGYLTWRSCCISVTADLSGFFCPLHSINAELRRKTKPTQHLKGC